MVLRKTGTDSEVTDPPMGRDKAKGICPALAAGVAGHWLQQSCV